MDFLCNKRAERDGETVVIRAKDNKVLGNRSYHVLLLICYMESVVTSFIPVMSSFYLSWYLALKLLKLLFISPVEVCFKWQSKDTAGQNVELSLFLVKKNKV